MLDVVPAEGDVLFGGCGGVWGIAVAGMARSYGLVVVCELAVAGMARSYRGIVYLCVGVFG